MVSKCMSAASDSNSSTFSRCCTWSKPEDARTGNNQGRRQHPPDFRRVPHGPAPFAPAFTQPQHRSYEHDPRGFFTDQEGHGPGSRSYYPVPNPEPQFKQQTADHQQLPWYASDKIANMASDNVTPWHTLDPHTGTVLICHPVASTFIDSTYESYLAGCRRDWESRNLRTFVTSFPPYSRSTSLYVWWHFIVAHGQTYGIFIPLSHTLDTFSIYGCWFSRLPTPITNHIPQMGTFVHTALSSKTCLQDHPQLRAYANNGSGNGYVALINIAMHHHHPSWLPTVVIPRHPDSAPVNQFRITLSTG
jgi:hypothetical protein